MGSGETTIHIQSICGNKLQKGLEEITEQVRNNELTPITRFSTIVELWIAEIERGAKLGDRSSNTVRLFRRQAGARRTAERRRIERCSAR
jgi:hypothetical protein